MGEREDAGVKRMQTTRTGEAEPILRKGDEHGLGQWGLKYVESIQGRCTILHINMVPGREG